MVRFGLMGTILLIVLQSAVAMIAALEFNSYDSVIDLDRNNGIPDVVSTAAIMAAAVGAAVLAAAQVRGRWLATTLAIVLSLLALDDVIQADAEGRSARAVFVAVTLVAAFVLILASAWRAPRRAAISIVVGLCLLMLAVKGAYSYDQFLNVLERGDQERGTWTTSSASRSIRASSFSAGASWQSACGRPPCPRGAVPRAGHVH